MADGHLCVSLFGAPVEPDSDPLARFDSANPAVQLIRSLDYMPVEIGDHVPGLKAGQISRTVIRNLANLESPSLRPRNAAAANSLADSEVSLVSRFDPG